MPKKLQKSIQDCLSKIKKQAPHLHFPHGSFSSATSKILSSCKNPKSFSYSGERKGKKDNDDHEQDQDHEHEHDHNHQKNDDNAATIEDIDRFLYENFKSLYGQSRDKVDNAQFRFSYVDESSEEEENVQNNDIHGGNFGQGTFFPPDLRGSHRFFVSPTCSSSVSSASTGREGHNSPAIPEGVDDCIAVLKVSPSPYEEFRRSMKEVIQARIDNNQRVDWDFIEELLFCYLKLNEKKQYRYILSAFVDSVVTLRQNSKNTKQEALNRKSKYVRNKGKGTRYF